MRAYLLLAAVVLAAVALFSARAVYMDEHIFLHLAKSAQTNLLFPSDTPGIFFGTAFPNFAPHTHPPVGEYYLAFLYAMVGDFQEVPFRLLFALFPIVAVCAFHALARRFTAEPLYVSLLFALSPAFFIYCPTLMMDIPMLAFLLLGCALYFGHLQGKRGFLLLAAVAFIAAVGAGYTALVPLACLFVGMLAAKRPAKELAALAAAPAALAVWLLIMTLHFGEFPLQKTIAFFATQGSVFHNLLATFSFIGTVAIFPWMTGVSRRLLAGCLLFAAALTIFAPWPSVLYRFWYVLAASAGAALCVTFFISAKQLVAAGENSGEAFLILWVPATLAFFIVVGDMINARYILLSIPALYLILFRDASRNRLVLMIVPTAALSLLLAYADYSFVNSYRDWVDRNIAPLQQQGFRIWGGAESGLRFYLERRGIETLTTTDTRPRGLDLIVRPSGLFRYSLAEPIEVVLTSLKTFTIGSDFPVRTFNVEAGAGLHDSRVGIVPFALSKAPLDRLEIAEVAPLPGAVWSPDGPILKQTEPQLVFPLKIPSNTTIEYELEGEGKADLTADGVRLTKGASPVTIWRNFRIAPKQFALE